METWRSYWREKHNEELYVCINRTNYHDTACQEFANIVDAVVEFPPHAVSYEFDPSLIGVVSDCHLYNYPQLVDDIISGNEKIQNPAIDFYRGVMLGWDNSARRDSGWTCWYGFSLEKYDAWLRHTIVRARSNFPADRRLVFINAWNEWAEGTYLEPDEKYGFASLNATARAIFGLPVSSLPKVLSGHPQSAVSTLASKPLSPSIGVHVHIYFEDSAEDIANGLLNITYRFDLFVTTDDKNKISKFIEIMSSFSRVKDLIVIQCPNIGRDVGLSS